MKKLDLATYRNKVNGCWAGKNIGGVLGAPFEAKRGVNKVDFYVQDLSKGLPANDDLDLQIVWLAAVERYGRNVNASVLGEYWLSYVIPNWAEYGVGKANLRAGLVPPMSGALGNVYKDSNGCWIRSEIWACLAPGHPDIAARYAYEDAIVDHADEGMYGEIFTAALQSAAFVESDKNKLIDIALSYIPADTYLYRAINMAIECYKNGVDFYEARKKIHNTAPGTFGVQNIPVCKIPKEDNEGMEVGKAGFDCPENVAFVVAAWLYGEDDFGRSICLANSLGEDTDCTCATLGATLGIISGADRLPEKWTSPLNDKIETVCIDKTSNGIWVPKTVTELTDRVVRDMPMFLGQDLADILDESGLSVCCNEGDDLYCQKEEDFVPFINYGNARNELLPVRKLCSLSSYVVRRDFPAFTMFVDYEGSVAFSKGRRKKIRVTVVNAGSMKEKQWTKITLFLPEGAAAENGNSVMMPLNTLIGSKAETEFTINADEFKGTKLEAVVDVSLEGRHSSGDLKLTLMRNIDNSEE
ncbi:MAG: ADP-ribosylglycohydrolase family protein [Lachnospiraceae bacterium]|jgi:ADP-ribosylglycohydrolase|nr:ADP-ribosylglycohydrolase family protein [Lachnospiraceae bacterium]MCH4028614.1 ADP-ribosylglycohydrolase family protein [Lachnospiraceae bacterium]MCH4066464.1 ADP-ribosylglycohydrolase family protein [Lachnospiraceae bacterium]MCH4112494.1 ADP-ribosylglycohydrolase family protein [Lachnospiraceae bacterium]MCI1353151.1 ADP-ribosylglycohydrolase family protein [Lachnospiraceae bacterium]